MTTRYVGPGGNNGNSGLTWALRKLTLNGVEDTPVVAGDLVWVGPGVYRETLTVDVSGGNAYVVGTVGVTNGSKQVNGNGTAWLANVAADYIFHITVYASGTDGVANGTATFTSAAGNFQVAMIGQIIQINTRNSYKIGAVAAANSITLVDVNGVGWPGAGGGLTYSVMSGQGPYDIDSVDNNTTIQLQQAWNGPTLTTIAYITYNPIRYVGDVTGEHTDSVGGIVRITGSDNDQTTVRADGISGNSRSYRAFRGFRIDTVSANGVDNWNNHHILIEDCVFLGCSTTPLNVTGPNQANITLRRSLSISNKRGVCWQDGAVVDDAGHLIENCIFIASDRNYEGVVRSVRVGGNTIRSCLFSGNLYALRIGTALSVGQTITVNNSILENNTNGLVAIAAGEVTEDYNTFYGNGNDRVNVAVGGSSQTYPCLLSLPILHSGASQASGFKFPWWLGSLSEWSQVRAITGSNEPSVDLHGIARPVTASKNSWGAIQFPDMERETGTTRGASTASLCLHDAGRYQIRVPVASESVTVSVYVYREANYAGNNPQMIVKQPGQTDDATTDTAAAGQWNLLTTTLTPAADPPYVVVELVSRNTAAAGNYDTFFDDLKVI